MPKILKFFDTITNISYTTFLKKIEKLGSRLEVEYFQACFKSKYNPFQFLATITLLYDVQ